MPSFKKSCLLIILSTFMLLLVGCSVGTNSLFIHPTEQGYPYAVTYDCLGGHINQMEVRTVFFAENSLLYQPSGTAGMLVEPKNGEKTLLGWYTDYTKEETMNGVVYHFDEDNRWEFDSNRVNLGVAPEEKLTLYARWAENPTIHFLDSQNPEGESLLRWVINVGNTISRPTSAEPTKSGFTLLDYYSDVQCTTKYEFGQVIDENNIEKDEFGNAYVNIYCKFIEGDYTRVKTISQLRSIETDPDGYFILANDLDLSEENWIPISEFTGVLDGNGYSINNLNLHIKNKVSGVAARMAEESSFGLFAKMDGAQVNNLVMKDTKIVIDHTSNVKLCAGVLAGRTKKTNITNCIFDGINIEATGACNIDIVVSPTVAGDRNTKLNNCIISNYKEPVIVTKGNFEVLAGN